MKQWKRVSGVVVSGCLTLAMIVSGMAGTGAGAKAKKATLKTKNLTVKVGKTASIKIKNPLSGAKYTFSTNKKKVATVSKKGVVKGVKKGTAVITVTEKKGKKKKRTVGKVTVKVEAKNTNKTPAPTTASSTAAPTSAPTTASTPTQEPTPTPVPLPKTNVKKWEVKKPVTQNNPIAPQRYMADPYPMEWNGRVYVYGTNDSERYIVEDENGKVTIENKEGYSKITTLNCYSSADLVNWRDEGEIPVAGRNGGTGPATWASNSWAPAAAHKTIDGKEKFFLYFADNGSGIGVLQSDSPTGPWEDPLGKQIVSGDMPNCNVPWLFDPAVLLDDDGTGYLYFGGIDNAPDRDHPKCNRVIKLADDMIHTVGEAVEIDAPAAFEDSGINKFGDKYYYSYCTNWDDPDKRPMTGSLGKAQIAYIVADNPMGPWSETAKIVMKNPNSGNNHHAMIELNGKIYMFYHSQGYARDKQVNGEYRTTFVDTVTLKNGELSCTPTKKGLTKESDHIGEFNPYQVTEAEEFAWSMGTWTKAGPQKNDTRNNRVLSSIHTGDWIGLEGVQFGTDSPKHVAMKIASESGKKVEGKISVYKGELKAGNEIATIPVSVDSKDYKYISAEITKECTGKDRLFFMFDVEGILVDTWTLSKSDTFTAPAE